MTTKDRYMMNIFLAFEEEYDFCRVIGDVESSQCDNTYYHRKHFAEWHGVNFHK